ASAASSGTGGRSVSDPLTIPSNRILRILQVVPRVRTVERLVTERKVGDDISLDRRFQQRPLEPRRVAQMTTRNPAIPVDPEPHQNVAAESFGYSQALAGFRSAERRLDRAARNRIKNLLDEPQALLDLADAEPDARVDVTLVPHRNIERQFVIRCVGK